MSKKHSRWFNALTLALITLTLLAGCSSATSANNKPASTIAAGQSNPASTQVVLPSTGGQDGPNKSVTLLETGSSLLYPLFSA